METTPRFRNLSINGTPHFASSSFTINEKDEEEHRDPEKECFMCRQANIYIKPIGMQQERRVARQYPPSLTRAKLEELSQKKHLTKKEARKLLQCYFPEIKNVKYFQLHKYHSCCYDPKHLNLCKNHITALQHEREQHPNHHYHKHIKDEDHYKEYERNNGHQNRVSFVRIKIEPTKGIPTRFLGPTALPESLADMLIKQVNRFEHKKKPPSFGPTSESALQMYNLKRIQQPYDHGTSRLSEQLANLSSDEDDDEDYNGSENDSDEDDHDSNNRNSGIRGYYGKVMDRSRMTYEKKIQTKQEKDIERKTEKEKLPRNIINKDLVVEDIDELNDLFVNEQESSITNKPLKKKKTKKRSKKRTHTHHTPKLNHWEIMALDQSKQEVCGCRHHVRRLEADQVIYNWCRCKDHLHKELKEKQKKVPPPPPPPAPSPPEKPKLITPPPKQPKIQKKTVGINATEPTTTELALAYDPSTVDYDVIQETLYYRTSSGRLVKPEITNGFSYNNILPSTALNRNKTLSKKSEVLYMTPREQFPLFESTEQRRRKNRSSPSLSNDQVVTDNRALSTNNEVDGIIPLYKLPNSVSTMTKELSDNDDDDDDDDDLPQFVPPKYIPEGSINTPIQSPAIPMSMQKSSKPTFTNQRPTPNYERESSIIANRRWFDQALGDQNLRAVHDGRYGLIAGTSTEQFVINNQLPDNDYVEQDPRRNRSNCTIS